MCPHQGHVSYVFCHSNPLSTLQLQLTVNLRLDAPGGPKWADDGSLWHAFVASVAHLSAEKHLDLSVLHGDGTNTVAKKGAMTLAIRGTSTREGRRSSP